MRTVFRISSRLRSAAPIPRDFGEIPGLAHLGLCHQSKIITDPEEFNATQAAISDPRFPNRGAKIEAYALTAEDEAKMIALPPVEQTPAAVEQLPVEEAPVEDAPERFRMEGTDIYEGDDRVGGVFDGTLRAAKGKADLRPDLEAWLQSQTE
jgi:hypothetical protein